jgi:hypothetical protein
MAKRKTGTARMHEAAVPASAAAAEASIKVIDVPAGGTLEIIVDVNEMAIPYTVAYAGRTVIKALVDRAEPVTLRSGSNVLSWAFAHIVKGWSHQIGFSINGGALQVLEKKSEANKDPDSSVGVALVRA